MKLVTYLDTKENRVGLLVERESAGNVVIDLAKSFEWLQSEGLAPSHVDPTVTSQMLEFIRKQDQALPNCRAVISNFREGKLPENTWSPEDKTRLMSPIPVPVSMRDGYAFRQHVETMRKNRGVPMIPEFDEFPALYFMNHLSVTGPGPVPVQKGHLDRLDYELEVAAVIGKGGKNIPAEKADNHIFGFMILNDWSARAMQMQEMKLNMGPHKGKDFANSLGPYLVLRESLEKSAVPGPKGEGHDLWMRAYVNDKKLSEGNLKDMTWTFAQLVERASYGNELRPGEIIGSGTVGTGCLAELNSSKVLDNQWLKPNDKVTLEIQELGRLENTISEQPDS